jgi:hypothetical protein
MCHLASSAYGGGGVRGQRLGPGPLTGTVARGDVGAMADDLGSGGRPEPELGLKGPAPVEEVAQGVDRSGWWRWLRREQTRSGANAP